MAGTDDVSLLLSEAQAFIDDDDAGQALEPALKAAEAARQADSKDKLAAAIRFAVLSHSAREDSKSANELGQQELEGFRKSSFKFGEAVVLLSLAELATVDAQSDVSKALQFAQDAVSSFRTLGDVKMEATALICEASLWLRSDVDRAKAADRAKQAATAAVPMFQQFSDLRGEALALHMLGASRMCSGNVEGGLRAAREALALLQKAGLRKAEASQMHAIATWLLQEADDPEEASTTAAEALGLVEDVFDVADVREVTFLRTVAKAHGRAGRSDMALKTAKGTLERFQDVGDRKNEGAVLELISQIHAEQGFLDKAIRCAKKAAYAYDDARDDRGHGSALKNLCQLLCRMGQYDKAMRAAQDALACFEEIEDLKSQAATLKLRGEVFLAKGEAKNAVRCITECRELYQDAKHTQGEAAALVCLSAAELANGDLGKAARAAEEAQTLAAESGDVEGEAAAYRMIGEINLQSRQYDAALKAGQRAVALFREVGTSKADEAAALIQNSSAATMAVIKRDQSGTGTDKSFQEGTEKAMKFAKEGLSVARRLNDPQLVGLAHHALAQCHTTAARAIESLKACEEAVKCLKQCGDARNEAAVHMLAANIQLLLYKDFDRARAEAEEGVWLCQQANDKAGETQAWEMLDKVETAIMQKIKAEEMQKMARNAAAHPGNAPQMQQMAAIAPPEEVAPAAQVSQHVFDPNNMAKLDISAGLTVEAVNHQIGEIAKVLIGDEEAIEVDMPLMEAGLTSATAVLLRDGLLQQLPGMRLPATLTFDYPSISSMTELIMEEGAKMALKNK